MSGPELDATTLALSGRARMAEEDFAGAVSDLTRALAARPEDALLLSDLGMAYDALGQYGPARLQLRNILGLLAKCAGSCPERAEIEAAARRLEGHLAVP